MPGITMCANKECPIKSSCYRSTAEPNGKYQSWADFEYKDGECDDYIRLNK